ncbi:MAG: hypothetical protein MI919_39885 [Holophagales bacterium]|nr:hypothetical protein [Holophagales bacterium]
MLAEIGEREWMGDVMHGPKLRPPRRAHLPDRPDHDALRLMPHAALYRSENASCLIEAPRHGFLRRVLPRRF